MAVTNTEVQFCLKLGNKTCENKAAFNDFIEEQMVSLVNVPDYICYVIDNEDDPDYSHKALIIRNNGNEPNVFFNSMDTFLKSRSAMDKESEKELANASDHGLMSNYDYTLLRNLDAVFNIEDATNKIEENSNIINEIFEESKKSKVNNKVYHIKEGKVDNFDEINEKVKANSDTIEDISTFIQGIQTKYATLEDYITDKIKNSAKDILDGYINHVHF